MGKRMLSILLCIIMAFSCLITACRPTPESAVVFSKDQTAMLDKAMRHDGQRLADLRGSYGIPGEIKRELSLANGKLACIIDAQVLLPESEHMPILRVDGADFTEAELNKIVGALFDDTPVYRAKGLHDMTKSDIEQWFITYKQAMQETGASNFEEDPQFQLMEELYRNAPDTFVPERWDGSTWAEPPVAMGGITYPEMEGLWLQGDMGKDEPAQITARQNPGYGEAITDKNDPSFWLPAYTGAALEFINMDRGEYGLISAEGIPAQPGDTGPRARSMQMKAEAAAAAGDALLGKMGQGSLRRTGDVYLVSAEDEASGQTVYGYRLCFSPVIGGVPAAYISPTILGKAAVKDGAYEKYWEYETAQMIINDSGVVYFSWKSPHKAGATLVEDAALLPFEQIERCFETMIRTRYEAAVQEKINGIDGMEINVSHVALGLMRIIEQNSIEHGLLVPAWLFYGTQAKHMTQEYIERGYLPKELYGNGEPMCIAAINAVDGGVIDLNKGY